MNTEWVRNYFKMVDTLDAHAIAVHFTEDGKFRFSNQPPAKGKQAVRAVLAQFFETIQAMHHENTGGVAESQYECDLANRICIVQSSPALGIKGANTATIGDDSYLNSATPPLPSSVRGI